MHDFNAAQSQAPSEDFYELGQKLKNGFIGQIMWLKLKDTLIIAEIV